MDAKLKEIVDEVGETVVRQAQALLKLAPLTNTDPNDLDTIAQRVEYALCIVSAFKLTPIDAETLKDLALVMDMWGENIFKQRSMRRPFLDENEDTREQISELYRIRAFEDIGPSALDFAAYCTLRYKKHHTNHYNNQDIHTAAHMGLKIAQAHGIKDLYGSYLCTEMVLMSGENFIEEAAFAPMKIILEQELSDTEPKVHEAYNWLIDYLETEAASGLQG